MNSESGPFGQFGVGVQEAIMPWKRTDEFSPSESAVEEASRFVGNLVGYTGLAAGAAATGGALGVGVLAAEGAALTARDLIHDYVEDDVSTGNVIRHVAFNFAVPFGAKKVASLIRGKIPRLESPGIGIVPLESGKPFPVETMTPEVKLTSSVRRSVGKFSQNTTEDVMMGNIGDLPNKEISILMSKDPTKWQQIHSALQDRTLELKGGLREMKKFLSSSSSQLRNLDQLTPDIGEAQKKIARQIGTDFESLLRTNRENVAILSGTAKNKLSVLDGLTEAEKKSFKPIVENPDLIINNPRLLQARQAWEKIRDEIADAAVKSGVKVEDSFSSAMVPFEQTMIPNYFPNYVPFDKLKTILKGVNENSSPAVKEFYAKTMAILDKEALSTGAKDGTSVLNMLIGKQKGTYASSLLSRHGFDFSEADPGASINRYIDDMYRAIEAQRGILAPVKRSVVFERYGLKAPEAIADETVPLKTAMSEVLAAVGGDTYTLNTIGEAYLHMTPRNPFAVKASNFLRSVNILNKMILSPIGNLGGFANTGAVFGLRRSLKTGIDMLTGSIDTSTARAAGAVSGDLATLMESEVAGSTSAKFLKAIGFTKTENILRTHAALTARSFILDTAQALKNGEEIAPDALRLLSKLGITSEALAKGLEPEQILRGMYRGSEATQFLGDVLNNPAFASSPMGKVFFQMKTFAYQQALFMKKMVFDEVKNGNFKPLARILSAGVALGEGVADVRDIVRGRNPIERSSEGIETLGGIEFPGGRITNRAIDNILYAGYMGMALDVVQSTITGQGSPLDLIGGPTVSLGSDLFSAGAGMIGAGSPAQAGKFGAEMALTGAAALGIPGAPLARAALPMISSASSESPKIVRKSLFATSDEKAKAELSLITTKKSAASERIKKALSNDNIDRAYAIAEEFNADIEDRYGDSGIPLTKFRISHKDVRDSLIRAMKKTATTPTSFVKANLPPFFRG